MRTHILFAVTCLFVVSCGKGSGSTKKETQNPPPTTMPPGPTMMPPDQPPNQPPPIVTSVNVSGEVVGLGSFLKGMPSPVASASILVLGTDPPKSTVSDAMGKFALDTPPDRSLIFFIQERGYFQTYVQATTAEQNITDLQLCAAEMDWVNQIAAAYSIDLNAPFQCHGAPDGGLNPTDRCVYGIVVGRILDNSATGHPVAGINVADFELHVNSGAIWFKRGPYFLDETGMPSQSLTSIASTDPTKTIGGLYVMFVEIPAITGGNSIDVELSIRHPDAGNIDHLFGPITTKLFRPYGVTFADLHQTQDVPGMGGPPGQKGISFMQDVRPLIANPTSESGTGCYACHVSNVNERTAPAQFFMGAMAGELYDALTHQRAADLGMLGEMFRVNLQNPSRSLLLVEPLQTAVNPHPIKVFTDENDPRYVLLQRWITEGARDDRSSLDKLNAGKLIVTADGKTAGYNLTGGAFMVRTVAAGTTNVLIEVRGLAATSTYSAHVHTEACATGGGGHYKIDPSIMMASEANEIWPTIHTDASGVGRGSVTVTHLARAEAQSVIIHEIGAPTRIACVDLTPTADVLAVGEFKLLAPGAGLPLQGSASLRRRSEGGTEVNVRVTGLTGAGPFPAHVHAEPCALNGGGHYKIDSTVMMAMQSNEIWPTLHARDNLAIGDVYVPHVARSDAASIVIHDATSGTKIACADLRISDFQNDPTKVTRDLFNHGAFKVTADGTALGYQLLAGSAGMVRLEGGTTSVRLELSGLDPAKSPYPAHVHALPCAEMGGGGHYKIDPAVMAAQEANEIWAPVNVAPDGSGESAATVAHYARTEAQSIVVHEPGTNQRIACADLAPGADATAKGTFLPLAAGAGAPITGTAELRRWSGGAEVMLHLAGLELNTVHMAHVHTLPCAQQAGGHYKIDPGVMAVNEANEIWMRAFPDGTGAAVSTTHVFQVSRSDAVSIVLHNPTDNAKRFCADLRW
jgi:hypothetical protein